MSKQVEELFYTFWYDGPLLGCIKVEEKWYWFVAEDCFYIVCSVYELTDEVHNKLEKEIEHHKNTVPKDRYAYGEINLSKGLEGLDVIYQKEILGSLIYKPLGDNGLEVREIHKKVGVTDLNTFYTLDEESVESLYNKAKIIHEERMKK